jgi:thioesterase domain-containing protein
MKRHVPGLYSGKVTLFRAKEVGQMYEHVGPRLGWDVTVLPRLDIVEVPGTHDTLVRKPNVKVLAAGLDDVLSRGSGERPAPFGNSTEETANRQVVVGAR